MWFSERFQLRSKNLEPEGMMEQRRAMSAEIVYKTDLREVDWQQMKTTLTADQFDNGRSPDQLRKSFMNSHSAVVAYADQQIIGTARILSDGVCNAYLVDVWTLKNFRRRGIATRMVETLLNSLQGQHVYLFTDDAIEFYKTLGFEIQSVGMGKVIGDWLVSK
jgi:predicted GNAT family acetyltransferase